MISTDRPTLTALPLAETTADAVVVGVASGPEGPVLLSDALPEELAVALDASLELLGVRGRADEVHRLPGAAGSRWPLLVLTGLGSPDAEGRVGSEALRRAAGAAVRSLAGTASAALALPVSTEEELQAVAEGAAMGAYAFTALKSDRTHEKARASAPVGALEIVADGVPAERARQALHRAQVIADAVCTVRDLVNTAPSHLYPETFADTVAAAAEEASLQVRVWDEDALREDGFGGILAVGQGSSRPPRLVRIEHAPEDARAHIALVGKGITFDTGGISLKPPASMMTMKSDMAGAATVFAAVRAAARLELPVRVTGWLAMAENMPSHTAIRPSDVITMRGGTTVEVMNTDAEGRVVMADALVAATDETPDAVLDVATLTGAQLVALGVRHTGVMGDDALRDEVVASADRAGELAWAMPIPEQLRSSLDSRVADISNMGERHGGMMTAAAFLREFVDAGRPADEREQSPTPWAHLDIAGPSFNESSPYGYTPKDATGVMVRTLVALLQGRAG
ncbi:leucyl aminopeptidase [Micrococcus sp.]|uniref:leucyl aminopeptidase n=1 Tax=Micrococcus sp. TaxID=1271 RepID=UPI002A90967B|nr:leucyl aminopeptidase [Micrococcus sp.]MDY6055532.1 leucyl aminopeptidase [Micrococcus sp.]